MKPTTPRLDLAFVEGNILINSNGTSGAIYRLPHHSQICSAATLKLQRMLTFSAYLASCQADFTILRVNTQTNPDKHVRSAAQLVAEGVDVTAIQEHFESDADWLDAHPSSTPLVYLIVGLDAQNNSATNTFERITRIVERQFGADNHRPINETETLNLAKFEGEAFNLLTQYLPDAKRATGREVQWLIARSAHRGKSEPALNPNSYEFDAIIETNDDGEIVYHPLRHDLWQLDNNPIREEFNHLKIHTEDGPNFQTFLYMGSLPNGSYPGGGVELLAALEALPFPADASIRSFRLPHDSAMRTAKRRILEHDANAMEQIIGSGGVGNHIENDERRYVSRELDAYLRRGDAPPLYQSTISIAISASSNDELDERVDAVKRVLSGIRLYRPLGSQIEGYYDQMPTATPSKVKGYEQWTTVEQIAALDPMACTHAGPETGLMIGVVGFGGSPRPVFLNPMDAALQARSPAILVSGTLGSGKTMLAQSIAVGCALRGSKVWTIDPKGDDHNICNVPELTDRSIVVDLESSGMTGLLDPLAQDDDPEARIELATTIMSELLSPSLTDRVEDIMRIAVSNAVTNHKKSSYAIIEELARLNTKDSQQAADALRSHAERGLGKLVFSDQSTPEMMQTYQDKDVITIRADRLRLPDPGSERRDHHPDERVSLAILKALAAYLLREARVAQQRDGRHGVVIIDEAWTLMQSRSGRAFASRLCRTARRFGTTSIFASQYASDLEELAELVPVRFALGQDSREQAAIAVRSVGVDDDPELAHKLSDYLLRCRKGRGLMRDLNGNVIPIQAIVSDPIILKALSTTPILK
jgi:hypothetical protein